MTMVLNYLVNRNMGRKEGLLVGTIVDYIAALPSANRKILGKVLREGGVKQGLVKRIEELFENTKERMNVEKELDEMF